MYILLGLIGITVHNMIRVQPSIQLLPAIPRISYDTPLDFSFSSTQNTETIHELVFDVSRNLHLYTTVSLHLDSTKNSGVDL